MDQGFFLGDMSKGVMLAALKPLIFFDDSRKNCVEAATSTPTVHIPPVADEVPVETGTAGAPPSDSVAHVSLRGTRFAAACKLFLKTNFTKHEQVLLEWHEDNLVDLPEEEFDAFISELQRSAQGTPLGRHRRSADLDNSDIKKLLLFLKSLLRKLRGE